MGEKEANKEQMARARTFASPAKKQREKEANKEQMARARAVASPAKKQREKEANKEQMAQARAIASPAKKQREKEASKKQMARARASRHSTQESRIRQFRRSVKYGAIFVCICCHRKFFVNGFYHLCFNCDKYIMKKKVLPMSNQNHLK